MGGIDGNIVVTMMLLLLGCNEEGNTEENDVGVLLTILLLSRTEDEKMGVGENGISKSVVDEGKKIISVSMVVKRGVLRVKEGVVSMVETKEVEGKSVNEGVIVKIGV